MWMVVKEDEDQDDCDRDRGVVDDVDALDDGNGDDDFGSTWACVLPLPWDN